MERGHDTKERILDTAQSLILKRGFAATSLDNILNETGVTKGAFFYHFDSKATMAHDLIRRFAANDFAMFDEWERRAEALSDDPLQSLMIFLKLFEEWLDGLSQPFAGCMFAVYVYESNLFEPEVNTFVTHSLERWQQFYERKFTAIIAERPPKLDVTAAELGESIVAILEGSFILSRASKQPELISRQSRLFRGYVKLLFDDTQAAA
jgi:TetR/AcrR family transcriptional repressor of nem operon